ncbi:MAG TPA: ATP-binding protein [Bacteroidales bacterium]|nr:ATP-binding protein [Bacteroidales bacterium]
MTNFQTVVHVRESNGWQKIPVAVRKGGKVEEMIDKWQNLLNLLIKIAEIPAALIMRLHEDSLEVFLQANSGENPYRQGDKSALGTGLYCETVIGKRLPLVVANALKSNVWKNNPDVPLGIISYYGVPIEWPDGSVFGTICILDKKENQFHETVMEFFSTLKKTLEDDLKLLDNLEILTESEANYRLLAENTSDVIWILNIEQNRFKYISPSIYQLRGLTPEEALEERLSDSLTPESAKSIQELIEIRFTAFLQHKDPVKSRMITEVQQPCKDGSIIWVEVSTQLRFNADGEVEVVGVSRSIEARKRIEAALLQREASLREMNASKDKFFSIIAHDLRSPFNGLLGLSDLLMEISQKKRYDEVDQPIALIRNSLHEVFELLENLLEWAQSQGKGMKFNPENVNMQSLIGGVISLSDQQIKKKSISVFNEVSGNVTVFSDKIMMSTILRNLLSNAIKFTSTGGMIHIRCVRRPDEWMLSVADNGVGMDALVLKKIFRIEEKVSTRGTLNEKGTGLGLPLCRELVERHGGRIWVESELGKGTTAYFTVPDKNEF